MVWVIERKALGTWKMIQTHTTAEAAERAFRAVQIHFPDREYRMRAL